MMLAWIACFVMAAAVSAKGTVGLYPTVESRIQAANLINDAQAIVALYGRIYDPTSLGSVAMIKMGGLGSIFVALLSIAIVNRHTRGDEEAGRLELIGATATGRLAPVMAALVAAVVANVALGAATAVSLVAVGLPGDGSIVFGLAWASVGIAFAAIAAVVAQVTTSARATTALSGGILAAVYVVRAIGDVASAAGPRWLVWFSPIGWGQQFRPYAGNRWWVLIITTSFAIVTSAVALALAARRDLGTGMLPTRPGPASASRSFSSPFALAWRLNRTALFGWLISFALVGALIGNLATTVANFINNPNAMEFFLKLGGKKALVDAYFVVELSFAGLIAAAFAIQIIARLRTEESELRAEPILAGAVGRIRWAMGNIAIALAGTTVLMLVAGASAGLMYGIQDHDLADIWRIVGASLVQLPAVWVMAGVAIAAFGLIPRLTSAGWGVLVGFILLSELGPLLNLRQWVMNISPFTHVPKLPGGSFSVVSIVALATAAAVLTAAGLVGLRRRDIS